MVRRWVMNGKVQAESLPQCGTSETTSHNFLAQSRLREYLGDVWALPLEELEGFFESALDSDVIDLADVPIQLDVGDTSRLEIVKDLAGRKTPHLSSGYVFHA